MKPKMNKNTKAPASAAGGKGKTSGGNSPAASAPMAMRSLMQQGPINPNKTGGAS